MKNLNKKLEEISCLMHRRTGYSLRHSILECRDNLSRQEIGINPNHDQESTYDFFRYNSDEWQIFIELLEEACK